MSDASSRYPDERLPAGGIAGIGPACDCACPQGRLDNGQSVMTKSGNRFLFLNHAKTETLKHDAMFSDRIML